MSGPTIASRGKSISGRRLAVLCAFLVAASLWGVPPGSAAPTAAGDLTVHVPRAFSPNGDGRKDEARVTYDLPADGKVTVVVLTGVPSTTVRVARLGRQRKGEHTWLWDGRSADGSLAEPGSYSVNVRLDAPSGTYRNTYRASTRIDTTVLAHVEPRTDYSLPDGRSLPVYPRSRVVRDSISLRPMFGEKLRWAQLVIMDARGRAVLRKDVSDATDFGYTNADYGRPHPDDVVWTARQGGKPLRPGRYRAFLRARDTVGNTQRSAVYPLWVSREALTWHEETRTVTAEDARTGACGFLDTSNGCYDRPQDCGQVAPSAWYVGGLSYRSAECAPGAAGRGTASTLDYLAVPETAGVRGVAAARVSFTGRPTAGGESDTGTLALPQEDFDLPAATVTGSTGGETAWVACPLGCRGVKSYDETFAPGVVWSFSTTGTDSVDVDSFTVTVRYLAVR